MSALVRLYPAAWRARYGAEFEAFLDERPPTARDLVDIVIAAVDARISPQVTSAPGLGAPWSSRISGASAILGGLLWSVVIGVAGVARSDGDYTLPIFIALGLMLLSLPGRYMRRFARPVVIGIAAAALGTLTLYAEILPWGPWLLVPVALILGALGPGAFVLAAARAGLDSGARWRMLVLVVPLPAIGVFFAASGLAGESIAGPLFALSLLPMGIAWMLIGARIAAGTATKSMTATGGLA